MLDEMLGEMLGEQGYILLLVAGLSKASLGAQQILSSPSNIFLTFWWCLIQGDDR